MYLWTIPFHQPNVLYACLLCLLSVPPSNIRLILHSTYLPFHPIYHFSFHLSISLSLTAAGLPLGPHQCLRHESLVLWYGDGQLWRSSEALLQHVGWSSGSRHWLQHSWQSLPVSERARPPWSLSNVRCDWHPLPTLFTSEDKEICWGKCCWPCKVPDDFQGLDGLAWNIWTPVWNMRAGGGIHFSWECKCPYNSDGKAGVSCHLRHCNIVLNCWQLRL